MPGLGMFALLAINDWLDHTVGAQPDLACYAYFHPLAAGLAARG